MIVLAIVGSLATAYLLWSHHRASNAVMMHDAQWPRSFPYPDAWLLRLNNVYDRTYPATGGIKLHAEFPRVRRTLRVAIATGGIPTVVSIGIIVGGRFLFVRDARGFQV